ncbi:MAG: suppressor of fused domain protein [Bacteroidales bacterium]|nr:suppressor of fused domain protein [Bacteroidales bacterium]
MTAVYTEKEMDAISSHIERNFGKYNNVLHESNSSDIHVDICVIEPTKECNHYTLVTMGMGAHKMNVPAALKAYGIDRAELLITLPADWDVRNPDETSYWVIRWLKVMARLPIEHDTWLGWGHTVPNGEPFAKNTQLSGMLVTMPYCFGGQSAICKLPNNEKVNFYQLLPLYESEMRYKDENGTEALENAFPDDFDMVVDINRKTFK